MSSRTEIGWNAIAEDGVKRVVFASMHGKVWSFFERPKRKGKEVKWIAVPYPPLSDWLELLDALERRATRDMSSPDEVERVRRQIREQFPKHTFS